MDIINNIMLLHFCNVYLGFKNYFAITIHFVTILRSLQIELFKLAKAGC